MKVRLVTFLAVFAAALALAFSAISPAAPNAKAVRSVSSLPAAAKAATPEPHPQIKEATGALRRADEHLEHAAHDFGGHRVEAMKATAEAIRQLEICLKYDEVR